MNAPASLSTDYSCMQDVLKDGSIPECHHVCVKLCCVLGTRGGGGEAP